MRQLERVATEKPARRLRADNRRQPVFGREGSDHFTGARGVFVDEHRDRAMKRLRSQAFRHKRDRFVSEGKSQPERKQLELPHRNSAKFRQVLPLETVLSSPSRQAIADRHLPGGQVAHEPQTPDSAARISAEVYNQPAAGPQIAYRRVERARNIDADHTWEHADL